MKNKLAVLTLILAATFAYAQPKTRSLSTVSDGNPFHSAGDWNAAVDAMYEDGCYYSFQMQAPPGVTFQPTFVEFLCGQAPGQTVVINSDDYQTADELNTAYAQLVEQGYSYGFQVAAPDGDKIGQWVEFWRVKQ